MISRTHRLALVLIAALLSTINACSKPGTPRAKPEFRVGVALSLTGGGATYGKRALNGIQLAADELNASPAFKTHPLRLIVEDTQSTSTGALTAFRKLVSVDQVPIVVGMVLSNEVLACAPIANTSKTVLLSSGAGSSDITNAGDYIFRNREDARIQASALARLAHDRLGYDAIAVLHSNAANGVSYRDSFTEAFATIGGKIINTVAYNEGKSDYRAEIEELRRASPKAVYLAGQDTEIGTILKQSHELAFAPQFLTSAGAVSPRVIEIAGGAAEGLICSTAQFEVGQHDARAQSFIRTFTEHFAESPDWVAANGYDAICIVGRLVEEGALTAEQLKAALYATKDFPGVTGPTTFDEHGDVSKPVAFVRLRNGAFIPLH